MQHPQIQFYRGSLVRLASGKLKQVEDLSSDDFIESARLTSSLASAATSESTLSSLGHLETSHDNPLNYSTSSNIRPIKGNHAQSLDENNNSVFNSPDTQCSPTMEVDEDTPTNIHRPLRSESEEVEDDDDDDIELDVVTDGPQSPVAKASPLQMRAANNGIRPLPTVQQPQSTPQDDYYIDSSVVKDFLEVGPPSSASPTSPTSSPNPLDISSQASTSTSSTSPTSSHQSVVMASSSLALPVKSTVLIKFFLESSRTIAFIEVPIEHPFFVFHRGWSSWNPQRTYDKFGLKCRKLKIGDICISLIRKQHNRQRQPQRHNHSPAN